MDVTYIAKAGWIVHAVIDLYRPFTYLWLDRSYGWIDPLPIYDPLPSTFLWLDRPFTYP